MTVTPAKPGSSLLYKKPEPKSKRTPKKDTIIPKTPVAGRGRKKAGTPVKLEDDSDEAFITQLAKPVARTGKRGRKPKKDDVDEEDSYLESPSKKPKTNNYLREMPSVDYNEQMAQDDEDNDSEEEGITLKSDYRQKKQRE